MSDGYIHVVGWEKFQHYGKREAPWIKDYTAQLHKDEYLDLSMHLRGVLQGIRLAYAASHRQLRDNTATLTRHLGDRVTRRDIERLCEAGFIQVVASTVLDQSKRENKSRKEQEAPPQEPAVEKDSKPRAKDPVWDFVAELEGEPLPRYRAARGRIVADLHALLSDTTADRHDTELRRRHGALAREWGDSKATARALVQHWHRAASIASPAKNGNHKGGFIDAKTWVLREGWQYPEADLVEDLAKKFILRDEERISLRELANNLQKAEA